MKKRIFALFLCVLMVFSLLSWGMVSFWKTARYLVMLGASFPASISGKVIHFTLSSTESFSSPEKVLVLKRNTKYCDCFTGLYHWIYPQFCKLETVSPVSSWTSRMTEATTVSPGSTWPPGKVNPDHGLDGFGNRSCTNTRPWASVIIHILQSSISITYFIQLLLYSNSMRSQFVFMNVPIYTHLIYRQFVSWTCF